MTDNTPVPTATVISFKTAEAVREGLAYFTSIEKTLWGLRNSPESSVDAPRELKNAVIVGDMPRNYVNLRALHECVGRILGAIESSMNVTAIDVTPNFTAPVPPDMN